MSDDNESMKADMVAHPLFKDLLAAHMACLRVSTRYLPCHTVEPLTANHFSTTNPSSSNNSNQELDHFMASYTAMLSSLEKNIHICLEETNIGFRSIEQELVKLTVTGFENGIEDEEKEESVWNDTMHYENEQGMTDISSERMKQKLKLRSQQDYKMKLKHAYEEIARKRKAYKAPASNSTTSVLKKWWDEHSDWPYPTSEEKDVLMKETGLSTKQLNKWFINQRNRNWN